MMTPPTEQLYLVLTVPDHWSSVFRKESIDAMVAEHVWEHMTLAEGAVAARTCFEYLKPGGYVRVAVPDGFHPRNDYIDYVKPGGTGPGADDHKILFTHVTLVALFERAGFGVELLEYFDDEHEFHCIPWDAARGTIHRSKRYDSRNADGELVYTSLIIDARKPD